MTTQEIKEVLERHRHWWYEDCDGWEDMRADLYGADLCGANLRDANLRDANLRGANLCGADLCGANLRDANLRGANLCGADLYGADLCGANLRDANLRDANLRDANLRGADLYGADLRDANLRGANLYGANLCGVDLCGANLRDANLRGADLCGAKNIPYVPYACPDFGIFIGWKKAYNKEYGAVIVQLEIPEDARRSSSTGRKCRCDKAKVLSIETMDGIYLDEAISGYKSSFIYKVGEIVTVADFCEDRWQECAPGIHFFINRQEAVNYE